MKNKPTVTKPKLSFKMKGGQTLQVFVYDAGQHASVGEHRMFQFGGDKTAGLIYDQQGPMGHIAEDWPVDAQGIWEWIQEWMEKGFKSEGLLVD